MTVQEALKQLAEDVKSLVFSRIEKFGTNPKTGTNTLSDSNLAHSIEVTTTDDGIVLQIADYWEFISRGWKRTGNYPGTFSKFIENINDWIRRKGINTPPGMTQNQLAWAIVKTIWDKGLAARPFMVWDEDGDLTKMLPELEGIIDKWFDELFDAICKELDKYFNN